MADPDPNTPQVVDPERVVDLTRLLQIRGPLGVLNVLDTIIPVVNMGDVVSRTVTVLTPSFRQSELFSAGNQLAAPANTIHAATGALPEGVYDIQINISASLESAVLWFIQHRNASDTATIQEWATIVINATGPGFTQSIAYELMLNESIRILNNSAFNVGEVSVVFMFARRRD